MRQNFMCLMESRGDDGFCWRCSVPKTHCSTCPLPPPLSALTELQCCLSGVMFHIFCLFSQFEFKNVSAWVHKQALTLFKTYGGGYYCYACVYSLYLRCVVCMSVCVLWMFGTWCWFHKGFKSGSCEAFFSHHLTFICIFCFACDCCCLCHSANWLDQIFCCHYLIIWLRVVLIPKLVGEKL